MVTKWLILLLHHGWAYGLTRCVHRISILLVIVVHYTVEVAIFVTVPYRRVRTVNLIIIPAVVVSAGISLASVGAAHPLLPVLDGPVVLIVKLVAHPIEKVLEHPP